MQLTRTSKPIQDPFSLDLAKLHARIDQDHEDELLRGYLASAVEECARYMGIAIAQQDYRATFDCWSPCLWLPMSPIVTVESVSYRDADGDVQEVDALSWFHSRESGGARVDFVDNFQFPALSTRPGSVWVDFIAGFDADDGSSGDSDPELAMPESIRQAVFLTFAHYYANRESVADGRKVPLPRGAEHLMDLHKVYR